MPIDELLQFLGLQCFLLAQAQGEALTLRNRVRDLEAELAAKPSGRKKAE